MTSYKPEPWLALAPTYYHYPAFLSLSLYLADFGFARYLTGADMAATLCGSPLYMVRMCVCAHDACICMCVCIKHGFACMTVLCMYICNVQS